VHNSNSQKISTETIPSSPCSLQGGHCLVAQLANVLGANILESIVDFSMNALPGSRLTLQRNSGEFTLQVTGPIQRSDKEPVDYTAHRSPSTISSVQFNHKDGRNS